MSNDEGIDIQLGSLKISGDPTKLYEALAKAQAEFLPVPKMNDGQIGKDRRFKYAGYATIMRCIRPALSKYGVAVVQPLHSCDENAVTTTIVAGHGASIQSSFTFDADPNPQEFGRRHTYYRRYQLQSMLGIEGDSDADDLPDPNQERAQFVDEARITGKALETPEAASAPPKAPVSAEPKPAPAEKKTNGSAKPSGSTTNGKKSGESKPEVKVETKPAETKPADTKASTMTINERLQSAMEQLGWKMDHLHAFYREHVDPADFAKAANLTIEQKTMLLGKMVEHKGIAPF